MKKKLAVKDNPVTKLRAQAEAKLAGTKGSSEERPGVTDEKIRHELQVHEIELEMQNEELRIAYILMEEARDLYVDLYEFSPVGYINLNPEGMICACNLTGSGLLDIARSKLINRRFSQFVSPADKDRWHRLFTNAMNPTENERQAFDLEMIRPDGSGFFAHLECKRLEGTGSAPQLRIALVDVSVLKHSEENLRIAAVAFETHEGIMITDARKSLLRVNQAFTDISGYTAAEVVGKNPRLLQSGRHGADFYAAMWETIGRTGKWEGEIWNKRKNGEVYPEHLTITAVKDEDGVVTNYVGLIIDITERKQKEEALRISEERMQLAKSAAGFGIFDRDLTDGTLHWDERARELWGLDAEETVSYEKFEAAIHPDDIGPRRDAINKAMDPAGKGEYLAKFRIVNPESGAIRWIASHGRVHFEAGRAVRIVGIMQDITEIKNMEQKLQATRLQSEALLGEQVAAQTASAIAHEINQPLAAISAYGEVALRALQNDVVNPEILSHAVKGIVDQSQRVGQSLHELLEFLHKGELITEPADINNIVKEALTTTQNDGFGGFKSVLELEKGLPPVNCNPMQVQKVLSNIIRNGVEAMRKAGVTAGEITVAVKTTREKNMVQITVRDSGPGIDAETAQRIFEPFFTTKSKGIGMGLTISRSLIEANGGQLWIDPDSRKGAVFHFTLPFAK